jgi:type II secretory pathway component GspD/PulD (secretin)
MVWSQGSFRRAGRSLGRGAVVLAVCACSAAVRAAPLALPAQGRFVVFDEAVPDVLSRFCQAVQIRCVVDPTISDTVRGHFTAADPRAFLGKLAGEYHLDWYFDGTALYVSPAAATVSRQFSLDDVSFDRLKQQLVSGGIWDDRFPVRADQDGRIVSAFGPPRFLDLVGQTIAALKPSDSSTVTIYRGSNVQKMAHP